MRNQVELENIEEMRRQEGIEDVELRQDIDELAIGDLVKVTLLTGSKTSAGETLLVRITSIRGNAFRGKLAQKPLSAGLSNLRVGFAVSFTPAHIYCVPKGRPTQD
jgi:hypothetical protein